MPKNEKKIHTTTKLITLENLARHMSRRDNISIHDALDSVAKQEGFCSWNDLIAVSKDVYKEVVALTPVVKEVEPPKSAYLIQDNVETKASNVKVMVKKRRKFTKPAM